jgi:EAL domain-containing protein (putative c-di-GMP-specific phosphodiesterase class I)
LLALGCPHAQGHLFSEPRSTEATELLLARAFEKAPSSVRLS